MQQLVQRGRLDAQDRLFLGDHTVIGHVHRHLQRRLGGALSVAGLQHVELALLHRELDVLHVAIVGFQPADDVAELGEDLGQGLFHRKRLFAHLLARDLGQGLGRADAGHHVLALGVDQELAIEARLAGGRIAREGHPGGRGVAHIAEHHRLHIDRGAPAFRDVVHAAIELGPFVHPAGEHRADRPPQLVLRILRERLAAFAEHQGLVVGDHRFPIAGA